MKTILGAFISFGIVSSAFSFGYGLLTFRQLTDMSHLVVIGHRLSSQVVPSASVSQEIPDDLRQFVEVVDTDFRVLVVYKGEFSLERIQMRHHQLRDEAKDTVVMPGLADVAVEEDERPTFLLFLKRSENGLFEPATGHDFAFQSVARVKAQGILDER